MDTNTTTQMSLLQNKIRERYDTLSRRLKQVAQYFLDNSDNIAFETVASIAQKTDVPPSTLIRFANAFGYKGFNDMKQVFRLHLMEETANYNERARLYRLTSQDPLPQPETVSTVLKTLSQVNGHALQQLLLQTDAKNLEKAISLLEKAKIIYVLGLRRSFSVATYLFYALRHLERPVIMVDGLGGMLTEQLSMIDEQDVLITICYSPYSQESIMLAGLASQHNAKQIAITDSQVSPMTAFSEVTFVVKEAQVGGFRSQIASLCLIQALTVALALKNTDPTQDLMLNITP